MEELRVKAEQIGVMLTTKQLEQFDTYYHRLIEKNKSYEFNGYHRISGSNR